MRPDPCRQGGSGGGMVDIEFRQRAFRRDIQRPSSGQPEQEIHVMAAFGQENGPGKVFPRPQTPHERMSHPVRADGFGMVDAHDAADLSAFHDFLDTPEIGMIPHDQAYGNRHARAFGLLQQVVELLLRGGRRLLQQDGISRADRVHRLSMVQTVGRRDDDAVHVPMGGKEGFCILEARTRRNPVIGGGLREPDRVRIDQKSDLGIRRQAGKILSRPVTNPYEGDFEHWRPKLRKKRNRPKCAVVGRRPDAACLRHFVPRSFLPDRWKNRKLNLTLILEECHCLK